MSLKSISAWRNVEAGQQDDVYYAGIPLVLRLNYGFDQAEPRNTDWFSQELQLTGEALDDTGANPGLTGQVGHGSRQALGEDIQHPLSRRRYP